MTTPLFLDLMQDSRNTMLAIYLWQDWINGKDQKKIMKEVDRMKEPEFKKFLLSIGN